MYQLIKQIKGLIVMAKSGIVLAALLICVGITIFSLIAPTATGQRMGPWMMDWYPQSSYMGFWMSLIWMIIIIVVVYLIYKLIKSEKIFAPSNIPSKSAEDILAERYAKGELIREQYTQMREDLKKVQ